MFCCELSLCLSSFSGDWGFDLTVSCLVRSAGSEKVLIFGFFFRRLVPCANYFTMRATLGKSVFGLSLDGTLGIMGIEGFISSTTCVLGGITYRGASRVSFGFHTLVHFAFLWVPVPHWVWGFLS